MTTDRDLTHPSNPAFIPDTPLKKDKFVLDLDERGLVEVRFEFQENQYEVKILEYSPNDLGDLDESVTEAIRNRFSKRVEFYQGSF